ncbi:Mrp/NBP35 family ATP-binding protein [bacterium]|nr:Mrp/NBP35 family ATP-binding protein [bacterium]
MNSKSAPGMSMEEQDQFIQEVLKRIRYRMVVFSGKGGVGKTTVAVNLAYALLKADMRTGLLDADITGPNVPKMTGAESPPELMGHGGTMIPGEKNGLKIISMAPMLPENSPVIWRGPLRSGAIRQFLADVAWGELDFLLADLPPGTGDEVLTAAQSMKPHVALVVTTPQEVSLVDCRRAVNMAKKLEIPVIAVVENMSGFSCPHCHQDIDVFGTGGGEKMAREMDVQFWGRIPMELDVRRGSDSGQPIVLSAPESGSGTAFTALAGHVITHCPA